MGRMRAALERVHGQHYWTGAPVLTAALLNTSDDCWIAGVELLVLVRGGVVGGLCTEGWSCDVCGCLRLVSCCVARVKLHVCFV